MAAVNAATRAGSVGRIGDRLAELDHVDVVASSPTPVCLSEDRADGELADLHADRLGGGEHAGLDQLAADVLAERREHV